MSIAQLELHIMQPNLNFILLYFIPFGKICSPFDHFLLMYRMKRSTFTAVKRTQDATIDARMAIALPPNRKRSLFVDLVWSDQLIFNTYFVSCSGKVLCCWACQDSTCWCQIPSTTVLPSLSRMTSLGSWATWSLCRQAAGQVPFLFCQHNASARPYNIVGQ